MMRPCLRLAVVQRLVTTLLLVLICSACTPPANEPSTGTPQTPSRIETPQLLPSHTPAADPFSDLPNEARVATRQGDPRPAAYWALWNACAPENRATQAAANGGRAGGFILMDDLLADPGIQLGDYPVATCQAGLALLQGRSAAGETVDDPLYGLAAQLLAAELNLNVGAETCPIAEEEVLGGHLVLSGAGFNGTGEYAAGLSEEVANATPRLVELLEGYNRGELCR